MTRVIPRFADGPITINELASEKSARSRLAEGKQQRLQPTLLPGPLRRSRSSRNGPHLASMIPDETGLVKATTEPKVHVLQHGAKGMNDAMADLLFLAASSGDEVANPVPDKNLNRLAAKERALRKGWIVLKRKVRDPDCGGQVEVFRVTDAGRARLEELGARNGAVKRASK
ncbi:hypothetical protein ABID58_006388 [Bradyrhizobium sp. S3.2.6]|uniref:hypothetical protein n=1 Tax=Bradyrhizobium sp. S3.2.6 TaxID=3156428 RepID=UPI0033918111